MPGRNCNTDGFVGRDVPGPLDDDGRPCNASMKVARFGTLRTLLPCLLPFLFDDLAALLRDKHLQDILFTARARSSIPTRTVFPMSRASTSSTVGACRCTDQKPSASIAWARVVSSDATTAALTLFKRVTRSAWPSSAFACCSETPFAKIASLPDVSKAIYSSAPSHCTRARDPGSRTLNSPSFAEGCRDSASPIFCRKTLDKHCRAVWSTCPRNPAPAASSSAAENVTGRPSRGRRDNNSKPAKRAGTKARVQPLLAAFPSSANIGTCSVLCSFLATSIFCSTSSAGALLAQLPSHNPSQVASQSGNTDRSTAPLRPLLTLWMLACFCCAASLAC
mmetsp:Transcript_53517/g.120186  ORF Transcript_53517/g.120186 Transcript_53517/m.120186 type:complete len:336 (-) Transcript_53517:41-1048(-)